MLRLFYLLQTLSDLLLMLFTRRIIVSIKTAAIEESLQHQSLYYHRSTAYPFSYNWVEVPISAF